MKLIIKSCGSYDDYCCIHGILPLSRLTRDADFMFYFNLDHSEYYEMLKKYNSVWPYCGEFVLEDCQNFIKEYLIKNVMKC